MLDRIIAKVSDVVRLLVASDYDALDYETQSPPGTSKQFLAYIREDRATLVMPPNEAWRDWRYRSAYRDDESAALDPSSSKRVIDIKEATFDSPIAWLIDMDMWTAEHGRSDYTLQLKLTDGGENGLCTKLIDLHVL